MKKYILALTGIALIVINSCKKDYEVSGKSAATPYALEVPKVFPQPIIPADNPMTVEGVKLGRMLYYDNILSSNGLTCSSCHIGDKSFSLPLFVSKTGQKISVPPHINLAWNSEFNWNGSEPKLDRLCLGDFGPDFFNTNMADLVIKLKNHSSYPALFKQAFNVNDVSKLTHDELKLNIVYSISQFMRTMISSDSKFDKMIKHKATLTFEEKDGYETFFSERGDCFHCHDAPLFTSNTFNNNGLDSVHTEADLGRFLVTGINTDKGKFSVPTLRNIELTAPYMHDGRFQTLEQVIEFYNSGVHWTSPNIDPIMTKTDKKYGLNLTTTQKSNLVKFLKTFTDTAFINNKNFRSPF